MQKCARICFLTGWGLMLGLIEPALAGPEFMAADAYPTAIRPWTREPAPLTGNLTFAIVADRNGGTRAGIFLDALRKINRLGPDIVMSVGDLIAGYTPDAPTLRDQWSAVDRETDILEMPFFHLPGNHDLANPSQYDVWIERYGRNYYAFTYGDVLFLCLCTQNPPQFEFGISPEQVAWFKQILEKHRNVKWTFVFMHNPLWTTPDLAGGFLDVEKALSDRPYTVFAGHEHRYSYELRNGHEYYVLSTTGGVIRDPTFYDHIVWVTLGAQSEPRIVNLTLAGIVRKDIISAAQRRFNQPPQIKFLPGPQPSQDSVLSLTLVNPWPDREAIVRATWQIPAGSHWRISPAETIRTIPATAQSTQVEFNLTFPDFENGDPLDPLPSCSIEAANGTDKLQTSATLPLKDLILSLPKPALPVKAAQTTPRIDGDLDDPIWRRDPDVRRVNPLKPNPPPTPPTQVWWSYDRDYLYLAVRATEPRMTALHTSMTERDGKFWDDDTIEVFIDPTGLRQSYFQFAVNAAGIQADGFSPKADATDLAWNGAFTAATKRLDNAWTLEMALPWKTLGIDAPAVGRVLPVLLVRDRALDGPAEVSRWPISPGVNGQPALFGNLELK